jgi:hypothetical protein
MFFDVIYILFHLGFTSDASLSAHCVRAQVRVMTSHAQGVGVSVSI